MKWWCIKGRGGQFGGQNETVNLHCANWKINLWWCRMIRSWCGAWVLVFGSTKELKGTWNWATGWRWSRIALTRQEFCLPCEGRLRSQEKQEGDGAPRGQQVSLLSGAFLFLIPLPQNIVRSSVAPTAERWKPCFVPRLCLQNKMPLIFHRIMNSPKQVSQGPGVFVFSTGINA